MPQMINRYGHTFGTDQWDDARIERWMIRNGGYVVTGGQKHGLGLIEHFKKYWSLLWPDDSQNWWTDLMLENILKHQFTSLVGPASSWKSGTVARLAIMDWSCYPDCTSVITSSTDMEGLKARVYAEITMVWHRARERYDWFPGNPVDSKCVITYTDVEEDKARDLRNSIVGVPCKTSSGQFIGMGKYSFLPSQVIDTPNGRIPIGNIKPGDIVFSAIGESRVEAVSSRIAEMAIRVSFSDGTSIDCTPEHPFLTSSGWVKAVDLLPHHRLISSDETLSVLQDPDAQLSPESEILLQGVRDGKLFQKVQGVREGFYSKGRERDFLHTILRVEMEDEAAENCGAYDFSERLGEGWSRYQYWNSRKSQGNEAEAGFYEVSPESSQLERRCNAANRARKGVARLFSGSSVGTCCENWIEREIGLSWVLQTGCCVGGFEIRRGSGWKNTRSDLAANQGFKTHRFPQAPRVVSITFYKPGDKISPARSNGGYRVCNIEVEGHPSYSVNNCIVHNSGRKNRRVWCIAEEFQFMQVSLLQAQDNLISNSVGDRSMHGFYPQDYQDPMERGKPCRGYKCIFVGNTNPSVRDNPLDIVSEPENGWSSIQDATETQGKTQVWKCKKHPNHPVQCYCVNLDALDSPNSAFPIDRPRWAHMAGPHKLVNYTVGSESYWSNGRGVFKFGLDQFKIITREVCEQFHAFDSLIWEGSQPTVKIGSLDAAYGSGDRCCLGWQEFGKCVDGKIRLLFRDHWLVPITIKKGMSPEDQIAEFCKEKMEAAGVPPENFFFDGRGTMAMSLAARWSPKVNAIEFGGSPTERPAGPDLYTQDKVTGQRRLKLAKEHFSKFVTELWWSWRYAIESDQIRGLTNDIVLDAQPREWYKVAGDKIEIEVKRDMKKRTGVSPDLADYACSGVEGARRRGFIIERIAAKVPEKKKKNPFEQDAKDFQKIQRAKQLQAV